MLAVINDTGIVVVLAAAVMLFGASRIPKLARNLGEASREFRKAQDENHPDVSQQAIAAPTAPETFTLTGGELDALISSRAANRQAPLDTAS